MQQKNHRPYGKSVGFPMVHGPIQYTANAESEDYVPMHPRDDRHMPRVQVQIHERGGATHVSDRQQHEMQMQQPPAAARNYPKRPRSRSRSRSRSGSRSRTRSRSPSQYSNATRRSTANTRIGIASRDPPPPPQTRELQRDRYASYKSTNPSRNCFVECVPFTYTAVELGNIFRAARLPLAWCQVIMNPSIRRSRGFAFVCFEELEVAQYVVGKLGAVSCPDGSEMKLSYAAPRIRQQRDIVAEFHYEPAGAPTWICARCSNMNTASLRNCYLCKLPRKSDEQRERERAEETRTTEESIFGDASAKDEDEKEKEKKGTGRGEGERPPPPQRDAREEGEASQETPATEALSSKAGQFDIAQSPTPLVLLRALGREATEAQLFAALTELATTHGVPRPLNVQLVRDRSVHKSMGFAFAEYENAAAAGAVISCVQDPGSTFNVGGSAPLCAFGNPDSFRAQLAEYQAYYMSLPGARWLDADGEVRRQYWDVTAYASYYDGGGGEQPDKRAEDDAAKTRPAAPSSSSSAVAAASSSAAAATGLTGRRMNAQISQWQRKRTEMARDEDAEAEGERSAAADAELRALAAAALASKRQKLGGDSKQGGEGGEGGERAPELAQVRSPEQGTKTGEDAAFVSAPFYDLTQILDQYQHRPVAGNAPADPPLRYHPNPSNPKPPYKPRPFLGKTRLGSPSYSGGADPKEQSAAAKEQREPQAPEGARAGSAEPAEKSGGGGAPQRQRKLVDTGSGILARMGLTPSPVIGSSGKGGAADGFGASPGEGDRAAAAAAAVEEKNDPERQDGASQPPPARGFRRGQSVDMAAAAAQPSYTVRARMNAMMRYYEGST